MIRYEESFENNKLYVKNIPHTATEQNLQKLFGKFGKIISVKLEKIFQKKKMIIKKQKYQCQIKDLDIYHLRKYKMQEMLINH